ncbi:hypothetical protein [Longimycelium tulufanense]|nr:hypothetical protein [Longimycelium tulufanense]
MGPACRRRTGFGHGANGTGGLFSGTSKRAAPWRIDHGFPRAVVKRLLKSYYTLLFQLPMLPEFAVRRE